MYPTVKMDRARHLGGQIATLIHDLEESQSDMWVIDETIADDGEGAVLVIREMTDLYGRRMANISSVLGDAVHNIRSQLDHFAVAFGGRKESAFPICRKHPQPQGHFETLVRNKFGSPSAAMRARLEALHPAPDAQGEARTIWQLHEMDIVDKHQTLTVAATRVTGWILGSTGRTEMARSPTNTQPLGPGLEICRVDGPGFREVTDGYRLKLDVAVSVPGVIEPTPVMELLEAMYTATKTVIATLVAAS